jgi:cystathionine beta-lyase/cystathionine gamma-synthase
MARRPSIESRLIHGENRTPKWDFSHHVVPPMPSSVTFRLASASRGARGFAEFASPTSQTGKRRPIYIYDRLDEPVRGMLEENLAAAEGADTAVTFASGMAAVAAALLVTTEAGTDVVVHRTLYGCTHSLLTAWMPRFGVRSRFVDLRRPAVLRRAIGPRTRVVYLETPTNPTLELVDLRAVAAEVRRANRGRGRRARVRIVVDNTFTSPLGQRPLALGADLSVASLTKHVSGFGTDLGGMVAGAKAWERDLFLVRKDFGGVLASKNAWPILAYGLPTLAMRLRAQEERALRVASFLEEHPKVARVVYPGLASYPQRDLALRQMTDPTGRFAPGTLLYFVLAGPPRKARRAAERLVDHVAREAYSLTLAVSLGQVRTLIEHPASMTHAPLSAAAQARAGIDPGGIRISVGLEDARDLVSDLRAALARA